MTVERAQPKHLDALISAVCDASATRREWDELVGILKGDPRALDHYLHMVDLHASLACDLLSTAVDAQQTRQDHGHLRIATSRYSKQRQQVARSCVAAVVALTLVVAAFGWARQQVGVRQPPVALTILLQMEPPTRPPAIVEISDDAGVGPDEVMAKDTLAGNTGQYDWTDRQIPSAARFWRSRNVRMLPTRYQVPRKFQKMTRPRRFISVAAATLPTRASSGTSIEPQPPSSVLSSVLSIGEPSSGTSTQVVDRVEPWAAFELASYVPLWRRNWDTEPSLKIESLKFDWRKINEE